MKRTTKASTKVSSRRLGTIVVGLGEVLFEAAQQGVTDLDNTTSKVCGTTVSLLGAIEAHATSKVVAVGDLLLCRT